MIAQRLIFNEYIMFGFQNEACYKKIFHFFSIFVIDIP